MSNEVKNKVDMDPKYIIKLTVTLFLTCMVVAYLTFSLSASNFRGQFPVDSGQCRRKPINIILLYYQRRAEYFPIVR